MSTEPKWLRVYFSADCDADGNCPACHIDFADCACPGPTQDDEFEYRETEGGNLEARRLEDEFSHLGTLIARRTIPRDENDE